MTQPSTISQLRLQELLDTCALEVPLPCGSGQTWRRFGTLMAIEPGDRGPRSPGRSRPRCRRRPPRSGGTGRRTIIISLGGSAAGASDGSRIEAPPGPRWLGAPGSAGPHPAAPGCSTRRCVTARQRRRPSPPFFVVDSGSAPGVRPDASDLSHARPRRHDDVDGLAGRSGVPALGTISPTRICTDRPRFWHQLRIGGCRGGL